MSTVLEATAPSWGAVRKGRRVKPTRVFFYAVEKFGKTGFGVGAPNPVFLDFEDGTAEYDVESFDCRGYSAQQTIDTLDLILAAPNGKQTVVIDTADAMERSIQRAIMREEDVNTIEEVGGGYAKGYVRASEQFASIFRKLDELREVGITPIVLAHAGVASFENPTGANYKRFEPKLEKRSLPIPKEWADVILFGQFEDIVTPLDKRGLKGKASGGRRRVLHTVRTAAYDAGNRYGLPAKLILSDDPSENYAIFQRALDECRASSSKMMEEVNALLLKLDNAEERESIRKWIDERKENTKAVLSGLNRLRDRVAAKETEKPKKEEESK